MTHLKFGVMTRCFLFFIPLFLFSCAEPEPLWTDQFKSCMTEKQVTSLAVGLDRFDQVLQELYSNEDLAKNYHQFVKDILKDDFTKELSKNLLIEESLKPMMEESFFEDIWQESDKYLHSYDEKPVYFVNGFAPIPNCIADKSGIEWQASKMLDFQQPRNPDPAILATSILNAFDNAHFSNRYNQLFIALNLGYTPCLTFMPRR